MECRSNQSIVTYKVICIHTVTWLRIDNRSAAVLINEKNVIRWSNELIFNDCMYKALDKPQECHSLNGNLRSERCRHILTDCLPVWLTDWQTHWLTDTLTRSLTDWYTDSLTHRSRCACSPTKCKTCHWRILSQCSSRCAIGVRSKPGKRCSLWSIGRKNISRLMNKIYGWNIWRRCLTRQTTKTSLKKPWKPQTSQYCGFPQGLFFELVRGPLSPGVLTFYDLSSITKTIIYRSDMISEDYDCFTRGYIPHFKAAILKDECQGWPRPWAMSTAVVHCQITSKHW